MDERLLAPCIRALLEGWTGPVHGLVSRGLPVRAVCIGDFTDDGRVMLWTDVGDWLAYPSDLALVLSLAECRDRVVRAMRGFGWTYVPTSVGWWRWLDETRAEGSYHPANQKHLRHLDPNDDTRLPDGSRLVDALALAAVWREVSRG